MKFIQSTFRNRIKARIKLTDYSRIMLEKFDSEGDLGWLKEDNNKEELRKKE